MGGVGLGFGGMGVWGRGGGDLHKQAGWECQGVGKRWCGRRKGLLPLQDMPLWYVPLWLWLPVPLCLTMKRIAIQCPSQEELDLDGPDKGSRKTHSPYSSAAYGVNTLATTRTDLPST